MEQIRLAHGSGGAAMNGLISDLFIRAFSNRLIDRMDDSADIGRGLAFTTDSFVVQPLFFPGGNIGKLSICGTANDLAMKGARPLFMTSSFIIGEGFHLDRLKKIVSSMAKEARNNGILIVAGDTKVINSADDNTLYINTAGIGRIGKGAAISSSGARPGDIVILSGNIADHGMAIMHAREDFGFKGLLKSDCACLWPVVKGFISKDVRVLRDPTRGGVASALNEIADSSNSGINIYEKLIPISEPTRQACNLLGLDPLHVANEGKFIAIVRAGSADKILAKIKKHPLGRDAAVIGEVVKRKGVTVTTRIGGTRILAMLEGEQLPRIC